ncbi:MAG TPA: hypothetical protein EYH31_09980, partial [Anaerolineae bacterium]|nr:hypothetical protein [Anaerolineae bacterium]
LGGFGTYLLALEVLEGSTLKRDDNATAGRRSLSSFARWVALVAGFIYAFSSSKLFYASLGQFNIASSQWIPYCVLYLIRLGRSPSIGNWRDAVLAGLFLTLQAWAEMTYASFLLVFLALYATWFLGRRAWVIWRNRRLESWQPVWSFVFHLFIVGLMFGVGITPILANMLPDLRAEGDFFTSGGGFADVFSADLLGYLLPTQLHPLLGGLIRQLADNSIPRPDGSEFSVNKGQHLFLGYVVMTLAAVGVWKERRRPLLRFWVLAALAFFLLTLGPSVRFNGYTLGIPGPFRLMAALPFFKGNRYPSRYSVMLTLSVAMLAAAGAPWVWQWVNRKVYAVTRARSLQRPLLLTGVTLGLIGFEHLSVPLPLSDMRVPPIYESLAATPGDFALLELPLGWRNGARVAGKQDVIIMFEQWYQTHHGKRLLGGNTSRNPEYKFQYFSEAPVIRSLVALANSQPLDATQVAVDQGMGKALLQFLNVRYVMVHREHVPPALVDYVETVFPVQMLADDGERRLFSVTFDPERPLTGTIALASDFGHLFLGEGWSEPGRVENGRKGVWAQRRKTRLLIPAAGKYGLRLQLQGRAADSEQQIVPVLNGHKLPPVSLPRAWEEIAFDLPARWVHSGVNDLQLWFQTTSPVVSMRGLWTIGLTGVWSPVPLLVKSAGLSTGDFAHIYVAGVDVSPNRRGYNLVAVSPDDRRVIGAWNFDTHHDPDASQRMAAVLASLPEGVIVAAAVADEASLRLTREGIQALRTIGAQDSVEGRFRWAHAVLGVKGAPPGTALEEIAELRPALVSVGPAVTAPQVAAVFTQLQLSLSEK